MRILIATGGTGGHIIPALEVARELRHEGHEILFAGTFPHDWREKIRGQGFPFQELSAKGFNLDSVVTLFSSLWSMAKAVGEAWRVLKSFKPNAVAGFGGYGAFPVVFVAAYLRYPTLIHEQNVVPGRANALLAKWVRRIAVSFTEGQRYFPSGKVILTGCPSHIEAKSNDRKKILEKFRLRENCSTILVLGGSQGSHRINREVMKIFPTLRRLLNFQVIHIAGKGDYTILKNQYEALNIPFSLFEFLDGISDAYQAADLIIARAGALTVTEIALTVKPAILIPYPYAGGHQRENAQVLKEAGIASVIEEEHLTEQELRKAVLEGLRGADQPKAIAQNVKDIVFPDAAKRVAQEILQLTR